MATEKYIERTDVALEFYPEITRKHFERFVRLHVMRPPGLRHHPEGGSAMWWVGDAYHFGHEKFGITIPYFVRLVNYTLRAIQTASEVAAFYPPNERRSDLSFEHHRMAKGHRSLQQAHELLAIAHEAGWSQYRMRKEATNTTATGRIVIYKEVCPTCNGTGLHEVRKLISKGGR